MHFSSQRHTPRIPTNYPLFDPAINPSTTAPAVAATSSSGHKHKRGSSSSRRAAATAGASASGNTAVAPNKTVTVRDQNMAELDPTGFAKLLNERLQRVVEDRAAMERLERLMSEVGSLI